jgi:methionine-S-sulfoxide reductase
MNTIYIAGGCFWGVEAYFSSLKGVIETKVGYANGNFDNPKYEDLKHGLATHSETVKIDYDENLITLENLLEHFLRFVDPYSIDKQGEDYGHQYRSGVYYTSNKDRDIIINYFNNTLKPDYKIEVLPLDKFFLAEEYHQDYLVKNPNGYCHINLGLIKKNERK